jgi:hypothetical protein
LPATPIAPSTPAAPTPTIAGPEGVTLPLEIIASPAIPPDRVVIQVGDIKLTAGQVDLILQAYPENQRMYANGPGRNENGNFVLTLFKVDAAANSDANNIKPVVFSIAGILASHTDEDIKRSTRGDEALLKAYYESHKSEYETDRARHILIRMQGSPITLRPGRRDLTEPRRSPKPWKSARRSWKARISETWRAPNPMTPAAVPRAANWASSNPGRRYPRLRRLPSPSPSVKSARR